MTTKLLLSVAAIAVLMSVSNGAGVAQAAVSNAVEMKHYRNEHWKFELDIPARWTVVPTGVGKNEVAHFISVENGKHQVLVSRHMMRPKQTPKMVVDENQQNLTQKGYTNFVSGETMIGSNRALTLDFETHAPEAPDGKTWYCRHYYVIKGNIGYLLAFGTSDRDAMFDVYDRMAKSFVFEDL